MEQIRQELHEFMEIYGLNDIRTIKKSQELDAAIVEHYKIKVISN